MERDANAGAMMSEAAACPAVVAERALSALLDASWQAWAHGLPATALADEPAEVLSRAILGQAVGPVELTLAIEMAERLAAHLAMAVADATAPPAAMLH